MMTSTNNTINTIITNLNEKLHQVYKNTGVSLAKEISKKMGFEFHNYTCPTILCQFFGFEEILTDRDVSLFYRIYYVPNTGIWSLCEVIIGENCNQLFESTCFDELVQHFNTIRGTRYLIDHTDEQDYNSQTISDSEYTDHNDYTLTFVPVRMKIGTRIFERIFKENKKQKSHKPNKQEQKYRSLIKKYKISNRENEKYNWINDDSIDSEDIELGKHTTKSPDDGRKYFIHNGLLLEYDEPYFGPTIEDMADWEYEDRFLRSEDDY